MHGKQVLGVYFNDLNACLNFRRWFLLCLVYLFCVVDGVKSWTDRGPVYGAPGRMFNNVLYMRFDQGKAKPMHKRQAHSLVGEDAT